MANEEGTDMRINKTNVLVETLVGAFGQDALEEFERFKDKKRMKATRRELEVIASKYLETNLRADNEKAIEFLNKVYRRAWALALADMELSDTEFPCPR